MKKILAIFLMILLVLSFGACTKDKSDEATEPEDPGHVEQAPRMEEVVAVNNPWTDCESLAEAVKLSGIELVLPEMDGDYTQTVYRILDKEILEVIFKSADNEIRLRKGAGPDDISGNYISYDISKLVDHPVATYTIKGDSSGYTFGSWTYMDEFYCLYSDKPMSETDFESIITEILIANGVLL